MLSSGLLCVFFRIVFLLVAVSCSLLLWRLLCCALCSVAGGVMQGVFGVGMGLLGRAGADPCVDVDVFRVWMGC